MGLGSSARVTLAEARRAAREAQAEVFAGLDPIIERARRRRTPTATFSDVTDRAFEARKADLKGDGIAGRWRSPLDVHVVPKIGRMDVSDIDQIVIRDVLAPVWHKTPNAARKALQRIGLVLQFAAAEGQPVDMQAVQKAQALLGKQKANVKHIPSMPWREIPDFYASLTGSNAANTVTLALRFLILTAVRPGEVRGLSLDEVDFDAEDGPLWTIPSDRMKAGRAHRVPLSGEAVSVLTVARKYARRSKIVFSGRKAGVPISNMAMNKMLDRRGLKYRPHGFRSSFRDWAAEEARIRAEVAEACLSHTKHKSAVESAYQRSDFLDERRAVMAAWARYVKGGAS